MIESAGEILPELFYTALASGLAGIGLLAEATSWQTISGGETVVGMWMAAVGLVALYAGFKLVSEKGLPTLQ
ncbi:hypothetical protein [Halapricum desulfuricans]|nr:hypothetical protein [Halapricum desulfuricans]